MAGKAYLFSLLLSLHNLPPSSAGPSNLNSNQNSTEDNEKDDERDERSTLRQCFGVYD
jgi:hypothetical protein